MKIYILISYLVIFIFFSQTIHAQENAPEELYQEGKLAYEQGDCMTAIEKLSAFKAKTEDKIASNKEFFAVIDEKIEICKNKNRTESIQGGKNTTGGFAF